MKRLLLTLTCIAFIIPSVQSQILIGIIFGDKINPDIVQMGFALGDNITTLTNVGSNSYSHNLALGLNLIVFPQRQVSIHTGAFFSYPTGASYLPFFPTDNVLLDSVLIGSDVKIKNSSLSLPIMAKVRFWDSFFLETGATVSYLLKSQLIYNYTNNGDEFTYVSDVLDDFNRFDVHLAGGLGYGFNKGQGININLRFTHGMVNVAKTNTFKSDPNKAAYNKGFQLLVEIPIKGTTSGDEK